MRRYLIPLIFGLGGFAVLVSLGVWQVQRLQWKESVLAQIDARIGADPVAIPAAPDPIADKYLPVRTTGDFTGNAVDVLMSTKELGAGHRIISAFRLEDGRTILIDEGFLALDEPANTSAASQVTVTGNLHWPEERDSWTPDPDLTKGLFYARDVDQLAAALNTDPILVVARTLTGTDARATPLPVTSAGIPNNHLGYAVQWFGLAIVWLGMTLFLLWRIRNRTV